MATFVLFPVFFLAITTHSSALFCICKDGVSDQQLQKNIDYACGAGADCTPITQNGPCYNPNTLKDHCNYAVNSYYQRKGATGASCDFSGTATTSPNPPTSGIPYNSEIPRAIWNPPLTRRGSLQPKCAARVGVSDSATPHCRRQRKNNLPGSADHGFRLRVT
ncbi:plasmodesmata callose-binding protein 3 [Capsicum annuum]|nr:plasmodesmata callose-binding protein 3 [Capsicum annuum]